MRLFSSLLAVLAIVIGPGAALADPTADLAQMQQAWSAVKSVHVDMKTSDGKTIGIDMILPDKFHETLPNNVQMIFIGPDVWMNMGSKWMKMPMTMPSMKTWTTWAKENGMTGAAKDYTATDLGPATLGTIPAEHYKLVSKTDNKTTEMWVGKDHLPIQVFVPNGKESMTVNYSEYNSVPDIAPPA